MGSSPLAAFERAYPSDLRDGAGIKFDKLGLRVSARLEYRNIAPLSEVPQKGLVVVQDPDTGRFGSLDFSQLPVAVPGDGSVTNAKFGPAPAKTVKGNPTTVAAQPTDLTGADLRNIIGTNQPNGVAGVDSSGQVVGDATNMAVTVAQAPSRPIGDKLTDYGYTPYDFIASKADRDKIRSGAADAPSCDAAMRSWLDGWLASAGECGASATLPPGTWILDAAQEALLQSPGLTRNRRFHLHFSPGAKLVPSSSNRFRYAVQGEWDAAANPVLLTTGGGALGDVWTVISPNNALSLNGITNVNVGDQVYKGVNGWQKILCRANYRYQFWDATTNQDDKGNLVIFPSIGDEYDCFIVGRAGAAGIDGTNQWDLGDEAIFIRGKWRKKKVQGGSYKGVWNPNTNTPALSNGNGSPGDWYVVGGTGPTFAPISLGNGNVTGIGESITTVPGEKIWCIAPGRWEKCYASPLFRGAWNPATDLRRQQWYPATAPAGTTNSVIGTAWAELPLASQGAYGDAYEITRTGTGTVGGVTRAWQRSEYAFYGANGWEVIRQDPNWDRGLLRFIHDEKTGIVTTGRLQIAPRSRASQLKEWSEGVYLRFHSLSRADYANYLYQGVMLDLEKVVVAGDDGNSGIAQGDCGICEGVLETRNLYIPTIGAFDALAPKGEGGVRRLEEQSYPRLYRFGVRHIDSYVTKCYHFGANGGFLRGYSVESEVWSVEQASWEGGYLKIDGANLMTGAFIGHGLRATPGNFEPTFQLYIGDLGCARYGVHLKGRQGTIIDVGKPILAGPGSVNPMVEQSTVILLEDCSDTRITNGMPTAGYYLDGERFCSFLRTRGGVYDTTVDGVTLSEMPTGVVFNFRHNANVGQVFSTGYRGAEYRVSLGSVTGHVTDTATKKLFYSAASRTAAKAADFIMSPTFFEGLSVPLGKMLGTGSMNVGSVADRMIFYRASDSAPLASIDLNGALRLAGPLFQNVGSGSV